MQSWRRLTFLDTDINQVAPTSESSSTRNKIRPLARSTPIPTSPPKSKQQRPQLSTIQQEDSREEGTVEPSESHPELESTLATREKFKEMSGIFVHDRFLPTTLGPETNGFVRKAPNQNAFRLVPTRENLTYLKDNWVHNLFC